MLLTNKNPRKKRLNLEEREQMNLIKWADLYPDIGPFLLYIKNEGKFNSFIKNGKRICPNGYKANKMGRRKGVSDLFLAIPSYYKPCFETESGVYGGFWIELKSAKGVVSDEQKAFLAKMETQGYATGVFYCWTDAANAILEYLGKPKQF